MPLEHYAANKSREALLAENDELLEYSKILEMQFKRQRQAQLKVMQQLEQQISALKEERSRLPFHWHERLLSPIMFIGEMIAKTISFLFSILVYFLYTFDPRPFRPKINLPAAENNLPDNRDHVKDPSDTLSLASPVLLSKPKKKSKTKVKKVSDEKKAQSSDQEAVVITNLQKTEKNSRLKPMPLDLSKIQSTENQEPPAAAISHGSSPMARMR